MTHVERAAAEQVNAAVLRVVPATRDTWALADYVSIWLAMGSVDDEETAAAVRGFGAIQIGDLVSARDRALAYMAALSPGDEVAAGKHKFKVWVTVGASVLLTRAGSAGRKLYALNVESLDPLLFQVIEVSGGSGKPLGKPPVARFSV